MINRWEEGSCCFNTSTPLTEPSPFSSLGVRFALCSLARLHVGAVSGGESLSFLCEWRRKQKQPPPPGVVCCVLWSLALTVTDIGPLLCRWRIWCQESLLGYHHNYFTKNGQKNSNQPYFNPGATGGDGWTRGKESVRVFTVIQFRKSHICQRRIM